MKPTAVIISLGAAVAVLSAQETAQLTGPITEARVFTHTHEPGGDVLMLRDGLPTIEFVAAEASFGGKVVKGLPYSAQAVTETTQTLSDGNRIRRQTTAKVYRDSEGRTRREQSLSGVGIFGPSMEPHQTVFINDPVAGVHYVLDPAEKTARKLPAPPPLPALPGVEVSKEGAAHSLVMKRRIFASKASELNRNVKNESLGTQVIEGVMAEGTRTVVTIPAGQIGNERPIEIVSERWYSPELQAVVMSSNSDPRMGTTTYRLTGISRAEPPRSLFEVPPDYKMMEGGGIMYQKALP